MDPFKRALVFLNVIYLLLSVLLFTFGLLIRESVYGRSTLLKSYVTFPATVTMAFGGAIFVMSLLTLIALYKQNKPMLLAFASMLFFVIGLEIGGGATCFVMQEHVLKLITNSLRTAESNYLNSSSASSTWDSVQSRIKCCGVDNYKEWYLQLNDSRVPDSCCYKYTVGCGNDAVKSNNIYTIGCNSAILNWTHTRKMPSFVIYIIFVILQISTILIAYYYIYTLDIAECFDSSSDNLNTPDG